MEVKNKLVAITGAGSGMGKEITLLLLKKGAKVAALDIREETLAALKKETGENNENIETYLVDVAQKAAVDKVASQVLKKQGEVDILINNAGIIQPFVKINDLDFKTINRVMDVDFFGALYVTKAFLPFLLKRPEAYIANTSSMGGYLPVPGQSIYGASKAALKLMTEGLYAELKDTNVHVSVIFPGAVATNIVQDSGVESPKVASDSKDLPITSAKRAAEIIVQGIENNKPQIFVGKDAKTMNFLYRLSPLLATNFIAKQMKSLLSK